MDESASAEGEQDSLPQLRHRDTTSYQKNKMEHQGLEGGKRLEGHNTKYQKLEDSRIGRSLGVQSHSLKKGKNRKMIRSASTPGNWNFITEQN